MNNYGYLLKLPLKGGKIENDYVYRLKRLICGYHAVQYFFKDIISTTSMIADVGAYFGHWSYPLLEISGHVDFIDYTDDKFRYIKALIPPSTTNYGFIKHDYSIAPLDVNYNKYDLVLCMDTLIYIETSKQKKFLGNIAESIKEGGHLIVDRRIPIKENVYSRFILNIDRAILMSYPYTLSKAGLLTGLSLKDKIGMYYVVFAERIKYLCKKLISNLLIRRCVWMDNDSSKDKIESIKEILLSYGLEEVDMCSMVDENVYKMIRNMEGYNLTNTFIGDYLWLALFRKKRNIVK